jgi:hypothetical protein
MDPQLLAFQQGALADAISTLGRVVTIGDVAYTGARSELEVDPGELQPGGYKYKRAFKIRFDNPALVATIKPGAVGVDDVGFAFKVLFYKVDHLGVLYYCGSTNV